MSKSMTIGLIQNHIRLCYKTVNDLKTMWNVSDLDESVVRWTIKAESLEKRLNEVRGWVIDNKTIFF